MKFVQAKNFTRANRTSIDLVVIHTAECGETKNAAENVAAWGAGPNAPQASWHYMVDCDSIVQSVLESDVAWHAGPVNGYSIGVEHAGYAKQSAAEWSDEYSRATLELSAELVGSICRRYGIPVRRLTADDLKRGERRGICGHVDVTMGLTGGKGHTDPGNGFPWSWYLERVRAHAGIEAQAKDEAPLDWPIVEHDGVRWHVAPAYIWPVGIGQAEEMAAAARCELPSKGLVESIWRAADVKIDAAIMVKGDHDGTPRTMASLATYEERARILEKALAGRSYRLLAGYAKDVIRHEGKVGIYGWQRADGTAIQPFFAGHARSWIDYSQGLRLVRRAT